MKYRLMTILLFSALFLIIDYYFFQAILTVTDKLSPAWRNGIRYAFWVPTIFSLVVLVGWAIGDPYRYSHQVRSILMTSLVAIYVSKVIGVLFVFMDDLQRGVRYLINLLNKGANENLPGQAITRSEFLAKTAVAAAAIPLGAMAYGVISGAHDYRVRRVTVKLPHLPKSFDGIKIGQLSDIHSGSFFNKTAVKGGVEMFLKEKPDVIFFTGDLVNNEAVEVKEYLGIFNKLKAPLGVYAVTGNHDYGDYHSWTSMEEKVQNFRSLMEAHRHMGFDLLMNEHRFIEQGGEKLAVIGIENWGAGRFSKYGKMEKAYAGTDEASVKLLLSHDPSHWDAQVRPDFSDVDVAFAGHTHGFQFGVELAGIKWSPSQYVYKQWAGLYQKEGQYLYVNRGFGYLGYPGRIGMPPELTIMELKRA